MTPRRYEHASVAMPNLAVMIAAMALAVSACTNSSVSVDDTRDSNGGVDVDTTADAAGDTADTNTADIADAEVRDADTDSTTDSAPADTNQDGDAVDADNEGDAGGAPDAAADGSGDAAAALDVTELVDVPGDAVSDADAAPDCGSNTACGLLCVDLQTDPTSCGFCGRTCVIPFAEAGCEAGECVVARCDPGRFDADRNIANGCELVDSCIAGEPCGTSCGTTGTTSCFEGTATCELPAEACNVADDNCNGVCDEGPIAGCRRGIHRANGNGHVYSDDLAFVSRSPYTVEAVNFFWLYSEPGFGMRPVFLCRKPNGKRFLTSDTACEIGVEPERTIGFWSPSPICDSIPLYRIANDAQGNHFYTISAPERDNALTNLGYRDEGIAGYVWRGP